MNHLTEIVIDRLEEKGVPPVGIPVFISDVANTISADPHRSIKEINGRLHSLGWSFFEMDDYTLQLIIASFEAEGLRGGEYKPIHWFKSIYKANP